MLFAFLLMAAGQAPDPADLAKLLTSDSYPVAAIEAGEQGTVGLEVEVAAGGKPTACRTAQSSGSEILDRETCALVLARGNFVATARRYPGKPFTLTFPVRWALENDVAVPFEASVARMVYSVKDGRTGDCREERVVGPMAIPNHCDTFRPLADPQLAQAERRGELASPVQWVFEVGLVPGDPAAPKPGERPGQTLLMREAHRLTIANDGAVIDCQTSAFGTALRERECILIRQNQRFASRPAHPDTPLRTATQYSVSYLRPVAPR